ncbi:MAG: type II secretion system F family protein [Nanoarchaeota archaeon]|nr:type II secretion system F family protein [Nanoarchaeota archaeon]MBU1876186.1 type II secretion system F family protein [Nanoarchaeota archaeon]
MPALQDFSVQINAGIPLFNILVNIAHSNYGEVSNEFKIIVKEINVGVPQVKALEESALKNPSIFFRRSLWQIINGLKAGSDMSTVIQEAINALSEEQILQIQVYGGKLNPLAMFYMLIAIIVPALSVTFIIILSSFLSFSEFLTKTIFYSILTATTFFQIIFLGIIKTRRPNLLS